MPHCPGKQSYVVVPSHTKCVGQYGKVSILLNSVCKAAGNPSMLSGRKWVDETHRELLILFGYKYLDVNWFLDKIYPHLKTSCFIFILKIRNASLHQSWINFEEEAKYFI